MRSTGVIMFVKTVNSLLAANFSRKQARTQSFIQCVIRMSKCVTPGRSSRAPSWDRLVQPAPSEDPDDLGWEIMDVDSEDEFTDAKAEISTGSSGLPQPALGKASARKKLSSSGSSAAVEVTVTAKVTPRPRRTKVQIYEQMKEDQLNALKCSPAAFQWGRFLRKIAANRKWSSLAFATKMSRKVRGSWSIDTGKARGFGGRWGWREIGVF